MAETAWGGLKTYGPAAVKVLSDAAMHLATNAWNAAKWSVNEILQFAEEHQHQEHAGNAAQELANETTQALELAGEMPIDFNAQNIAASNFEPNESYASDEYDFSSQSCASLTGSTNPLFFSCHSGLAY